MNNAKLREYRKTFGCTPHADLRSGDPERQSRAREWIDADAEEVFQRTKSFIEAMQALYKEVRERN